MPNNAEAVQAMQARLADLNSYENVSEDRETVTSSARTSSPVGDVVCDPKAPADWRTACQQAMKDDPKGVRLYQQLSQRLKSSGATLRRILECDALMAENERAGLECFQSNGLVGDEMRETQIAALEFDLLIETFIKDR